VVPYVGLYAGLWVLALLQAQVLALKVSRLMPVPALMVSDAWQE